MSNKFADALKKDNQVTEDTVEHETVASKNSRPVRKNKKHIGGYFAPEVSKQIRQIALEEDSTVQQLLEEGLDMIFHSRKKPTIARK